MKKLFKSEITGKVYEDEQECLNAEKEHKELTLKQNKEKEERKEKANEIRTAYEDYLKLRADDEKKERELYNKYIDLRNKFVDKYGSYHLTVSTKNDLKPVVDFDSDYFSKMLSTFFDRFIY